MYVVKVQGLYFASKSEIFQNLNLLPMLWSWLIMQNVSIELYLMVRLCYKYPISCSTQFCTQPLQALRWGPKMTQICVNFKLAIMQYSQDIEKTRMPSEKVKGSFTITHTKIHIRLKEFIFPTADETIKTKWD